MDILDLPFNRFVGFEHCLVDDHGCLKLTSCEQHLNHVGTVHAGVLFSLAEAASGNWIINALDSRDDDPMAVLRSSSVKYRKPATGELRAFAEVDERSVKNFPKTLKERGRVLLDVSVRVLDANDQMVFTGSYTWFVSRNKFGQNLHQL